MRNDTPTSYIPSHTNEIKKQTFYIKNDRFNRKQVVTKVYRINGMNQNVIEMKEYTLKKSNSNKTKY